MLNLSNVALELDAAGAAANDYHKKASEQLIAALDVGGSDSAFWSREWERINGYQSGRMTAKLLSGSPVLRSVAPGPCPTSCAVTAVDGSQIPIDRHAPFPYYLINIGHVILYYGTDERPHLSSDATLFFRERDVCPEGEEGEFSYVTENQIAQERNRHEIQALSKHLDSLTTRENVLALIDGPLVLWASDPTNSNVRTVPVIEELNQLQKKAAKTGALLVGYISRPGSRDVINVLRVAQKLIPEGLQPICDLDRINDGQLFERILLPGHRSELFESDARVLRNYNAGFDRIGFYYLNTGREISRVELPLYADSLDQYICRSHALTLDQVQKGGGYPVALTEAHEQAVVRAADREAVNRLIEREMIRQKLTVLSTRKSLSKQIRPI